MFPCHLHCLILSFALLHFFCTCYDTFNDMFVILLQKLDMFHFYLETLLQSVSLKGNSPSFKGDLGLAYMLAFCSVFRLFCWHIQHRWYNSQECYFFLTQLQIGWSEQSCNIFAHNSICSNVLLWCINMLLVLIVKVITLCIEVSDQNSLMSTRSFWWKCSW